jgi:hypothetical protein
MWKLRSKYKDHNATEEEEKKCSNNEKFVLFILNKTQPDIFSKDDTKSLYQHKFLYICIFPYVLVSEICAQRMKEWYVLGKIINDFLGELIKFIREITC